MLKRAMKRAALPAVVIFLAVVPLGCRSAKEPEKGPVEKPIATAPASAPQPVQTQTVELPPTTLGDVEAAVHRVFGDDLTIVNLKQPFVVGDFNGDNSQDVAVVARPVASRLSEINQELANWIIQDADRFFIPPSGKAVVRPPVIEPAHVADNEVILVVIHGYGPKGWRDPAARQAYLVKHAPETFLGIVPATKEKAWRAMRLPVPTEIIRAQRDKRPGFIFWTGSAYGWHEI